METNIVMDWLSITHPQPMTWPDTWPKKFTMDAALRGYRSAVQMIPDGRIVAWDDERPEMGHHVRYTGQCLNKVRKLQQVTDIEILKLHAEQAGKITRLDLALDAYDSGLDILKLYNLAMSGDCATRSRTIGYFEKNGAKTTYVGSRSSECMLRIYEKAAKEGDYETDWIRLELELKSSKAQQVMKMLLGQGMNYASIVRGLIRDQADWVGYDTYQRVLERVPGLEVTSKVTAGDTRKWLLEQCAPSLAKLALLEGDEGIFDDFTAACQEAMNKLQSEIETG